MADAQTVTSPPPIAKASLLFVFLVVFIDMLGFGIIMPVLPKLIGELTGAGVGRAAVDAGWLSFAYAAMQFVFGPIVGNLSDRFGRRPVLLGALGGYAISYCLMGLAPTLFWLFAARIVAGVMGASFSTAYAYIADVSPPDQRSQNFGLIGTAFGLGFIFGPALGGLLGDFDTRLPFFAAGGLAALNLCFGAFMLRESLPPERRRAFDIRRANAFAALKSLGARNRIVLWYAAALFVWLVAQIVYPIVFAFYAIAAFGWGSTMIGIALACVGLAAAIVQGGLIRIAIPRMGERNAVILGCCCMAVSTLAYIAATVFDLGGWIIFAAIPIGALNGFVQPSINGLMSRAVSEANQGELQGAVASLSGISSVIGPPMFAAVFAFFTISGGPMFLPGAPFVLAGAIALIALAIFLRGHALHAQRDVLP